MGCKDIGIRKSKFVARTQFLSFFCTTKYTTNNPLRKPEKKEEEKTILGIWKGKYKCGNEMGGKTRGKGEKGKLKGW